MLLGIVSDTHGYFDPQIAERFAGVALILHAGDVGGRAVLAALGLIAPVVAVRGNADAGALARLPRMAWADADELRILVTHIAGLPERMPAEVRRAYERQRPDVVVFGHSHLVRSERADGALFFNPGAAGKQGFHGVRTVGVLEIRGREVEARHIELLPRYATRSGD